MVGYQELKFSAELKSGDVTRRLSRLVFLYLHRSGLDERSTGCINK